jgi:adhesin transport system outer membrane protein
MFIKQRLNDGGRRSICHTNECAMGDDVLRQLSLFLSGAASSESLTFRVPWPCVRRRQCYRRGITISMMFASAQTAAQQVPAPPSGSLIVDPQQGATPRPIVRHPVAPPGGQAESRTRDPATSPGITPSPIPLKPTALDERTPTSDQPSPPAGLWLKAAPGGLPVPDPDPLNVDTEDDPILNFSVDETSVQLFRRTISDAIKWSPNLDEAKAQVDEAAGAQGEAEARVLPVADLSLSTFQIVDRAFSNDPNNVLERSRPSHRTDGLIRVQQPLIDFGSSLNRIRASRSRLDAARANVDDVGTQIALRAISAWYTVYGYRALVRLARAFVVSQRHLRSSMEERVSAGAAAPGDLAQVDSYIASSEAQIADFSRRLSTAEAEFSAAVGAAPAINLSRAPTPSLEEITRAGLTADTDKLPVVRSARLAAEAARADVRAAKGDRLPQLSAALDAGRYGVIETARDYDVRGSLTLSMRLGGGAAQRVDQARARLNGSDARLRRVRIEAQRDAEIALSDVVALQSAQAALQTNYIASRRSRDVLAERYRVSRGTLFDLLATESNYFNVAARFVQNTIELDTARYALLARTGRLLSMLDIRSAELERQ